MYQKIQYHSDVKLSCSRLQIQCNPIRIPVGFFLCRTDKTVLKFMENNMEQEEHFPVVLLTKVTEEELRTTILDFKTALVIKAACYQ